MNRFVARSWFPASLLIAVAVVFLAFGPPSAGSSTARLEAMAPAGATVDAQFSPAPDASVTEVAIATQWETVRRFPETVDAYIQLGNAYLQNVRESGDPADYQRAEAAFEQALTLAPANADAMIGLGVLNLARHEFAAALALGQRAVELAPRTARAHGVLVDALTELGRYDEAVDSAQRMVDLRPDLASLSRVSYQRELRGDIDGAIEAMARAFDAAAGSASENREYLRVLIGDLHLLKGDAAGAARIYEVSLDVVPGFVWAEAGLGRVAVAQGDLDAAIEHYRAAVETLPLPELFVALGDAQAADGRADDAAATFELVRAMQALFAENGVRVELELAIFEANHGDPTKAVDLARRAYADQPNVKAADALAWALYKAGNIDEAAALSVEARRLGSPYGQFAYHAAMIELERGEIQAARGLLEAALEVAGTMSALDSAAARATLAGL